MERIINILMEKRAHGMLFQIAEAAYEYGIHYVLIINGIHGFHSTDYDRVKAYMNSIIYE